MGKKGNRRRKHRTPLGHALEGVYRGVLEISVDLYDKKIDKAEADRLSEKLVKSNVQRYGLRNVVESCNRVGQALQNNSYTAVIERPVEIPGKPGRFSTGKLKIPVYSDGVGKVMAERFDQTGVALILKSNP